MTVAATLNSEKLLELKKKPRPLPDLLPPYMERTRVCVLVLSGPTMTNVSPILGPMAVKVWVVPPEVIVICADIERLSADSVNTPLNVSFTEALLAAPDML